MANTKMVEAICVYRSDAYAFAQVEGLQGEAVYVCTTHCDKRLDGGRKTLVKLGKSDGEFPVTEVSMCGVPECRSPGKQG